MIVLIEPHVALALQIARRLGHAGLHTHVITSGQDANRTFDEVECAAAVINVDTPDLATVELVNRLRVDFQVAVILLGHSADDSERTSWLNRGVDDFVPPPSSPEEVVARVCSVLRRGRRHSDTQTVTVGPLVLDETTHQVLVFGRQVDLSPMEFKLLRHLAKEPGRVFSRGELLRDVWGYTTGGDSTVTVHVRTVRAKLEPDVEQPSLIRTLRGVGYYLDSCGSNR